MPKPELTTVAITPLSPQRDTLPSSRPVSHISNGEPNNVENEEDMEEEQLPPVP